MLQIFEIAFPIFLMMDPIGNIPLFISSMKNVDAKRKKLIVLREMVVALLVIIAFNFLGEGFFKLLRVSTDTVQITGGIILFLISLKMIFPSATTLEEKQVKESDEPFIVPLAVPLVAGPSVLAVVMLYSHQIESNWIMIFSISIAWIFALVILLSSAVISKILRPKGILACERLMGLILVMIGIQMLLEGIAGFITHQCLNKLT